MRYSEPFSIFRSPDLKAIYELFPGFCDHPWRSLAYSATALWQSRGLPNYQTRILWCYFLFSGIMGNGKYFIPASNNVENKDGKDRARKALA